MDREDIKRELTKAIKDLPAPSTRLSAGDLATDLAPAVEAMFEKAWQEILDELHARRPSTPSFSRRAGRRGALRSGA